VNTNDVDGDAHGSIPSTSLQDPDEGTISIRLEEAVSPDADSDQTPSDRVAPGSKQNEKGSSAGTDALESLAAESLEGGNEPARDEPNTLPESGADPASVTVVVESPSTWTCGSIDSSASTSLARFLRFTDFVPCDYNEDGVVDILALSKQLSTAFVYEGASNGIFTEGVSLDLPFRPACSLALPWEIGVSGTVFLVSGTGLVSLFVPIQGREDSGITSIIRSARVLGVENEMATVSVVDAAAQEAILYQVSASGVLEIDRVSIREIADPFEWYLEFADWQREGNAPLPVLSPDLERTTVLADLQGDSNLELVLYENPNLNVYSFEHGEATRIGSVACPSQPEVVRVVDVNQDGICDLLLLQEGTLRVVFGE